MHGAEGDVGVLQVAHPVVALGAVVDPVGAADHVALVADRNLHAAAPRHRQLRIPYPTLFSNPTLPSAQWHLTWPIHRARPELQHRPACSRMHQLAPDAAGQPG